MTSEAPFCQFLALSYATISSVEVYCQAGKEYCGLPKLWRLMYWDRAVSGRLVGETLSWSAPPIGVLELPWSGVTAPRAFRLALAEE